jgi:hypothetical protein
MSTAGDGGITTRETNVMRSDKAKRMWTALVAVAALAAGAAQAAGGPVMSGTRNFTITDGLAQIQVQQIGNTALDRNTGALRLEIWAFAFPFAGTAQPGYRIGVCTLSDILGPLEAITTVRCNSVPITNPPDGTWSLALLLTEFAGAAANDGYVERDYKADASPVTYGKVVPAATVDVVEYYWPARDHYFITASAIEIAALDALPPGTWQRTGATFGAYSKATGVANGVCRFYIPPPFGDSHFYSASPDDCALVVQKYPQFVLEGSDVFYILLPDPVAGVCPLGSAPVFRLFNQRPDTNHRYTTNPVLVAQTLASGFVLEGYGLTRAAMCSPP